MAEAGTQEAVSHGQPSAIRVLTIRSPGLGPRSTAAKTWRTGGGEPMRTADQLRDRGVAAAALFKPSMGGWIVQIYPGGIRRRS